MGKGSGKDYQNSPAKRVSGSDNAGQNSGAYGITSLYDGLDRNLPRMPTDSLKAPSVNAGSTEGSRAHPTPKSLGPRTA
jgi:hypothetical protein